MNNEIRQLFPFFTHHKNLVYLDSAGTSLKPNLVIQAINDYYQKYSINNHSEGSNSLFNEVWTTIQQTREIIAKKIKKINPNCLIIIDACQSIAHLPINVKEWDIDALVFSGHKVYGPTGIGVLWLKKKVGEKLPDILWGGGKKNSPSEKKIGYALSLSQKFEVGTLPLAQIFGLRASFEFLNNLDNEEIRSYEKELKDYAVKELAKLKKIVIYNQHLLENIGIILFNLQGYHAHDVADYLGKNNICVRAGNFCCPYLKELIGVEAAIRISLFVYNNKKDVDELIHYLKKMEKQPELIADFLNPN